MSTRIASALALLALCATAHAQDYTILAGPVPGQSFGSYAVTLNNVSPGEWQVAYITPSVGAQEPSADVSEVRLYFYDDTNHPLTVLGSNAAGGVNFQSGQVLWGPGVTYNGPGNPLFSDYGEFIAPSTSAVLYNDGRDVFASTGAFSVAGTVSRVEVQLTGKEPFVGNLIIQ